MDVLTLQKPGTPFVQRESVLHRPFSLLEAVSLRRTLLHGLERSKYVLGAPETEAVVPARFKEAVRPLDRNRDP